LRSESPGKSGNERGTTLGLDRKTEGFAKGNKTKENLGKLPGQQPELASTHNQQLNKILNRIKLKTIIRIKLRIETAKL
jgi:hypothetical protein